jgi:chromosome segregation and condensation protein ScpB
MLKRLHQKEVDAKLTKAALETLAIVAYKQPILRGTWKRSAAWRAARRSAA